MNPEDRFSQSSEEPFWEQTSSKEAPRLDGVQLLVVEDEPDNRELFTFILEMAGALVKVAKSGTEALQVLQSYLPDILISDISLPDVDGCTLVGQLKTLELQRGRELPAIALTAAATDSDRIRILEAGFQIHLSKPIEPERLIEVVAILIKRQNQE